MELRLSLLNRYLFLIILAAFCFTGCGSLPRASLKAGGTTTLALDSVSLEKKSFNPVSGESIIIRYKPAVACLATVSIYNNHGQLIRTLEDRKEASGSAQNILWNGRDNENTIVPAGVYFYTIELERNNGVSYIYNPYKKTHGKKLQTLIGGYDEAEGSIDYKLPQAAMVRIRVGLKDGGPLLATLIDWTPQEAGDYSIDWDGKDASGSIDLSFHPKRNLVIFAYSLADNSIIVKSQNKVNIESMPTDEILFDLSLPADRYLHARHNPGDCHEPKINVEILAENHQQEKIPVVEGIVPVKVSIAPQDRLATENSRYEIMFFVDTVFLFEDESGFSPFTYIWDTRGLSEGEHLLTVNLWTYDDHCGVVTKEVFIIGDTK